MSHARRNRRRIDSATAPVVQRLDRVPLAEPVVLPTGGKRVDGVLAHVGLLSYTRADDASIPPGVTRRELVRADTLSDPTFLDALRGLPVTVEHVPGASPRNMARVRVGTILAAHFDAETGEVRAEVVVDDQRGLDAMARGLTDVSLGYDVEVDETPGDWIDAAGQSHRYDAVQVRRIPNHLALTRQGRAGNARVRADGVPMDLEKLAMLVADMGIVIPADADEQVIADAIRAKIDAMAGERDAAKGEADRVCVEIEVVKGAAETARADAVSAAVAELDALTRRGDGEAFRAGLVARARLDALAKAHGVDGSTLDTSELGRAIVRAAVPSAPEGMSDAYVAASLDLLSAGKIQRADARFDSLRTRQRADAPADGISTTERLQRAAGWRTVTTSST